MSDIDDAPIVTADENKELSLLNEAKKEKLKVSKGNLSEEQQNMRLLAPLVEQQQQQQQQQPPSSSPKLPQPASPPV